MSASTLAALASPSIAVRAVAVAIALAVFFGLSRGRWPVAAVVPGAAVVTDTVRDARSHATVSYDPNARPTIMGGPDGVRGHIEELIALSDVVKASEDDVEWLYAGQSLPDVMAAWGRLGPGLVVVTRGKAGVTEPAAQPGAGGGEFGDGGEVPAPDLATPVRQGPSRP